MMRRTALALGLFGLVPILSHACSLCTSMPNVAPLREDAAMAKLVIFGALSNPRLGAAIPGSSADGAATDLTVERVVKSDPILSGRKVVTLPRYVPIDPKNPPKFLVFCDVTADGKLDPYRGCPATPAIVDYLTGAMALPANDPGKAFAYFGRFIDHADPEIAGDAFREFARAGDAEIARAAKQLDPVRLRKLLTDPQTPPDRLALFGYLLGGCGTPVDAELLGRRLRQPDDRAERAYSGLLAGYTQLRPDDGWRLLAGVLADPQQPFTRRLAALSTVRFFYRSQTDSRPRALHVIAALVPQGDLSDLAIEDLRQWHEWGLTTDVLAQYGKKSHAAPMVRRAIIRYALTCPKPEAKQFVENLRRSDAQLLRDVEESLEFEKAPAPVGGRVAPGP
jgi:hypothetical protein